MSSGLVDYLDALRTGDARRALAIVDELIDSGASFDELCEDVLRPALYTIGDLWEREEIGVGDEHLAASISETVLACVGSIAQAPADAERTILVSCTDGEAHAIGARMVGETFAAADWAVRYLGASTPPDAVASATALHDPDVLALSTTMRSNLPAVADTIKLVRAAAPNVRIVVGGQAYEGDERLADTLGADFFEEGLRGLVERVESVII
jgi:MerR family transcriptional regulator, light-induced transcriptional regulator